MIRYFLLQSHVWHHLQERLWCSECELGTHDWNKWTSISCHPRFDTTSMVTILVHNRDDAMVDGMKQESTQPNPHEWKK